ncbi:MAG: trypsin-like peptidase domain-containing protein [Defluviitaleaceae bacterium]|nr:trypsin-like peptidase domain-containing protein [Defluviitaleaceae bacterium]
MNTKKIILILISFCIGGATLGLGLGAGYALTQHFLPEPQAIVEAPSPAETAITTVHVNPLVVPIDPQEPSFVEVIPRAKAAVVSINVTAPTVSIFGRGEAPGSGSGFIFAEDEEFYFIATNNHVIENTISIRVSLDDIEDIPAVVVGYDTDSDVAVIAVLREELEKLEAPFAIAPLGDSDLLRMGDAVIAIGNAMGEGQTVTRGIISALSLNIPIPSNRNRLNLDVLQTDAAVNRGNSGGPLVNQNGEVVGIVTAKLIGADIEGMGYALPINNVRPLLEDILETGNIRRAYLGINAEDVTEWIRNLFNLPSTGVLVGDVESDSPAEESGLQRGDLIVEFDEKRIESIADLQQALENARPADEVVLVIYRDGERIEISIVLGSRLN